MIIISLAAARWLFSCPHSPPHRTRGCCKWGGRGWRKEEAQKCWFSKHNLMSDQELTGSLTKLDIFWRKWSFLFFVLASLCCCQATIIILIVMSNSVRCVGRGDEFLPAAWLCFSVCLFVCAWLSEWLWTATYQCPCEPFFFLGTYSMLTHGSTCKHNKPPTHTHAHT